MAAKPDILVSIDLGTTYTGVAWMTPRTPIQVINDWPGSGDRGERKVPTTIIYNADGSISSWGFMCADDDENVPGKTRREFFKIFLDDDTLAAAQKQGLEHVPRSTSDAQRYITDYLKQVYGHIKESIETQCGRRHFGGWAKFRQEITSLFEVQIEGIMRRIKEQLDWLGVNDRPQQVDHMILSGGLGSSAYVRDRLQQQFTSYPHPNASQIAVIPCQDPQLVVVRGLLLDHQQKMISGNLAVLATRIARASYGIIVREIYSPAKHFNEDIVDDQFEHKQKWAINQIEWLIRKGDVINPAKPLVKSFDIRLKAAETTRSWDAKIVTSHNEVSFLPSSMKHAGAFKLCEVKSNLTGVQQEQLILKEKRGTCFSRGFKFYICQFDIRVIVAPADLRFELWFAGQKFSGNHEPIAVTWEDEGTSTTSEK
ncbi:hypothetical protein CABS01_16473 [Colletotrichum abscissum]|uniref:Hsp70 family chaperone n=1 Tax=Colletotrichum costaricense TaxID=1209916 RepID=A0AAI9YIV1_9PEZI|nr:uncharacterized protein CCOS01_15132 [Colletotrichum costaricense]XP_060405488.1 uncharacterized protein CABS01_16473 [Colletotrichum abscissum]KAK1511370.1 hypothetical protein CCOS01_15132 [Colletotrichum costaricense]KAK1522651.1 hypothetical protein CABS01_16473 [Colletotrichum abscissum]